MKVARCLTIVAIVTGLTLSLQASALETTFRVRYRSTDTVYLDAGLLAGLSVGDRLEVVRDGTVVGIVEVVFLADRSASARPMEAQAEIQEGDLVRPLGVLHPPSANTRVDKEDADAPSPSPPPRTNDLPTRQRTTRLSGVLSLVHERYTDERDQEDVGRDYDHTTARLSLRGRDLGGLPLSLRVRLRRRQVDRGGDVGGTGIPAREDRDRLYELSLRWAPDGGRYVIDLGRLGAGPLTGIGHLDGISSRFQVRPIWQVGAFFGQRPELGEIGFASGGTKYGLFSRWTPAERGLWEVFLAGLRDEGDHGVARDVAILETRLGGTGSRWSFHQRAELDLGTKTGGAIGESDGQLTQLALALTGRFGARGRFVLSYDRYDPFLWFEDREERPGQAIRDLLRQGLRANVRFGRVGGVELSLFGGVREGEGDDDSTYSFGVGVHRVRSRGIVFNADFVGFSNRFTEGQLATLRASFAFGKGHSLGLTAGATTYEVVLDEEERFSGWFGLQTWIELPASLYARGDLEVLVGDDAEGKRLRLGLGYRF